MSFLARSFRPASRRLATVLRPFSTAPSRFHAAPEHPTKELGVGELEGVTVKIEPLRRTGEDERTMRARLLYQSRKRGILESDLLLSTFADINLPNMSRAQMAEYDLFLDENDWDIYYWATQEAPAAGAETAGTPEPEKAPQQSPRPGEWAQTVGTFKPAYRPVPARWRDSDILRSLREHVRRRRADDEVEGAEDVPKGISFMPPLFDLDGAGKKS